MGCHSVFKRTCHSFWHSLKKLDLFSASVQLWKIISHRVKHLLLKLVGNIRWECRIQSLTPTCCCTAELCNSLLRLALFQQADPGLTYEARNIAGSLADFRFVLAMIVWGDILLQVNDVSKSMQCKTIYVVASAELLIEYISNY